LLFITSSGPDGDFIVWPVIAWQTAANIGAPDHRVVGDPL
jgi:hypothetical protein